MPRLFGHNLIFVLLAALVMYLIGFVWYGVLFADLMAEAGMTEETATAAWRMWGVGMLIPLLFALGLAGVAQMTTAAGLAGYIRLALMCAVFFAIATALFAFAYDIEYTETLILVDIAHLLLVFAVGGAILSFGRKTEAA